MKFEDSITPEQARAIVEKLTMATAPLVKAVETYVTTLDESLQPFRAAMERTGRSLPTKPVVVLYEKDFDPSEGGELFRLPLSVSFVAHGALGYALDQLAWLQAKAEATLGGPATLELVRVEQVGIVIPASFLLTFLGVRG